MHENSTKLTQQRARFTVASKRYAHLNPTQKAQVRQQIDYVSFQKDHGKTYEKLLKGRQLYISNDIQTLVTTGKPKMIPGEICVVLCDFYKIPISGNMQLHYWYNSHRYILYPKKLDPASFLFSNIPSTATRYHFVGIAENYYNMDFWNEDYLDYDGVMETRYKQMLLGYVRMSHDYGVSGWIQGWLPILNLECHKVHCHTEIWPDDYMGYLHVMLRDYSPGVPPGTYLFDETMYLNPFFVEPQVLDFMVGGLTLKPGGRYYLHGHRIVPSHEHALPIEFYMEINI